MSTQFEHFLGLDKYKDRQSDENSEGYNNSVHRYAIDKLILETDEYGETVWDRLIAERRSAREDLLLIIAHLKGCCSETS
jgi:hypothetical protein